MSDRLTLNLALTGAQIDQIARRVADLRAWPERMTETQLLLRLRAAQLAAEQREREAGQKTEQRPICTECLTYRVEPGLKVCGGCLPAREERGWRAGWRAAERFHGIEADTNA